MKYYIIGLLMTFFTLSALAQSSSDSTKITPPVITAVEPITVHVLHLAKDVRRELAYIGTAYQCPAQGKLISSNFFEANSNTPSDPLAPGYFFFVCSETYLSNNPYYLSLLNNVWVDCPGNMKCTMKTTKPPYIRFIVKIPDMDRESNETQQYVAFTNATFYIGNTPVGSTTRDIGKGPLIYTWAYDINFPPALPTGNYSQIFIWSLQGTAWNAPGPMPPAGSTTGSYKCGTSNQSPFGFALIINPESFARSYVLTCRGYWRWDKIGNVWNASSTTPDVMSI